MSEQQEQLPMTEEDEVVALQERVSSLVAAEIEAFFLKHPGEYYWVMTLTKLHKEMLEKHLFTIEGQVQR